MRRISLILIGMLLSTTLASNAKAEPIYLNFWQSNLLPINKKIDVSNGFTGLTYTDFQGFYSGSAFDSPFTIDVYYGSENGNEQSPHAYFTLAGMAHSTMTGIDEYGRNNGHLIASGVVSDLRIHPVGTSPEIPSWLPSLTVSVFGEMEYHGAGLNVLVTTISIMPHDPPAHTPEPTSLAVFGVGLGVLAVRAARRSRRSG